LNYQHCSSLFRPLLLLLLFYDNYQNIISIIFTNKIYYNQ
jgi:hypothetical protein